MSKPFTIGYAGSLDCYFPEKESPKNSLISKIKTIFWTFQNNNIGLHTRSGYYLFRAIQILKEKHNIEPQQLKVNLWGMIHSGNKTQAIEMGIDHYITIEGHFNKPESLKKLSQCDMLFLPLESEKNGQKPLFIPGKVFDYLISGKPILALSGPSDCQNILEKSGLALILSPFDADEIANRLAQLINNKDLLKTIYQPNTAFIESQSFRAKTEEMAKVFDEILQNNG